MRHGPFRAGVAAGMVHIVIMKRQTVMLQDGWGQNEATSLIRKWTVRGALHSNTELTFLLPQRKTRTEYGARPYTSPVTKWPDPKLRRTNTPSGFRSPLTFKRVKHTDTNRTFCHSADFLECLNLLKKHSISKSCHEHFGICYSLFPFFGDFPKCSTLGFCRFILYEGKQHT